MQTFLQMFKSQFIRNYSVYFTGSMIVAFLNYLFYPLLSHLMDVASFGEVQVVISFITQVGIIFSVFSILTVSIIASSESIHEKSLVIAELRKIVRWIVAVLVVILIAASPFLSEFFKFDDNITFLPFALSIFASSLMIFRNGYLQGTKRFALSSVASFIGAASKLVCAFILVWIGWDSFGAVFGIALSQFISWGYLLYVTRSATELKPHHSSIAVLEKGRIRRELIYALVVLVSTGSITFLYTADILVMKHYFDPQTAGLYAGISAIAKIVFFALGPLATVLLPSAAGTRDLRKKNLGLALIVFGAIGAVCMWTFYEFHDLVISLLIGARYVPFAGLLPLTALFMLITAFANLLTYYFLALRQYDMAFVLPAGALLTIGLSVLRHASVIAVIEDFVLGSIVTVLFLILLYAKNHFNTSAGV